MRNNVEDPVCIFCRKRGKLTNEHIIPKRWRSLFPGDSLYFTLRVGEGEGSREMKWQKDGFDLKAKCVCGSCNAGWMRKLDEAVEPGVKLMIQGQAVVMDRDWKVALSMWAVKTAIIALKANTPAIQISDVWCHMFYAARMPPSRARVWLGACEHAKVISMYSHVVHFEWANTISASPDGYILTLAIGALVSQVAIFGLNDSGHPRIMPPTAHWSRADLVPLWPQIFAEYQWPPAVVLTENDLGAIADRFATGRLPAKERSATRQGSDGMAIQIPIDLERVADFSRRHHIRRLAVFGSVLRDDFSAGSDVDVLVEFEAGCTPGWEIFDMEDELSSILGRRVDLNTPGFLSRSFRRRVIDEALVLYAA